MNPRLPTELKRIKGTLNVTREKQNKGSDVVLDKTDITIKAGDKLPKPKSLQTTYGKKFYKMVVRNMMTLHVLSYVDLPQIEMLARDLEQIREIDEIIQKIDATNPDTLDDLMKYQRINQMRSNHFDSLASKFYITPLARVQLKLGELDSMLKEQAVKEKLNNPISNVLNLRNN